jgi:transketolase
MDKERNIFFVCADFGAPTLDRLRTKFKDRFINVGIAEQNLINISTGLAIEGFTVYAYAIAAFLTMRAYEQIRVNLSLYSHLKEINVNLIGVGAGLSYDVSGPTHHCLEDISIMRTLPHLVIFSPSDWMLVQSFIDYSMKIKKPKYIRLDGKPLPQIYNDIKDFNFEKGFSILRNGRKVCLISTGYMTHKALKVADILRKEDMYIGVIDVFMLRPFNDKLFFDTISNYKYAITLEEGFINKAGLDCLVSNILTDRKSNIVLKRLGFQDNFVFDIGSREYLHKKHNLDVESIVKDIIHILKEANG